MSVDIPSWGAGWMMVSARRYLASRKFINTILNYRRKSTLLKNCLTPRVRLIEKDEEENEEEERSS